LDKKAMLSGDSTYIEYSINGARRKVTLSVNGINYVHSVCYSIYYNRVGSEVTISGPLLVHRSKKLKYWMCVKSIT